MSDAEPAPPRKDPHEVDPRAKPREPVEGLGILFLGAAMALVLLLTAVAAIAYVALR